MLTYLQICQRFVAEHGIQGGTGPNSVTGQTGELANVVRWISSAALDVDNLWLDWKYLWVRYTGSLVVGDQLAPAPAGGALPRLWRIDRLKIRRAGDDWQPLTYYTRARFEDQFDPDNDSPGQPHSFTVLPDNTLQLNCIADGAYELKGEFWRRPVMLANNGDLPLIPGEYFRIIMARAAIYYGNREDAPEIISGAESEYLSLKDKLESDQLEDQERRRSSTDRMADHDAPAYLRAFGR